jgi:DNA gyrase/topoisomerase IV subunit B
MESSLKADRPSSPCDDGRARKFRRIEQHEHVLKRGTMYVGSCTMAAVPCWVLRREGEEERAAREPVPHVPALYKLYDEVVTNAADQVRGGAAPPRPPLQGARGART